MKYKGNLKVVNTYQHFKGIRFKQAQENRRARKAHRQASGPTLEEIERKYKEERAQSYEVANKKQADYGDKFILMGSH